jgi:hypothetical protein
VLFTKGRFEGIERGRGKIERLAGLTGGDHRSRQKRAPPMGQRVIGAVITCRPRHLVFGGKNRLHQLVLPAQRGIELALADDPHRDQVLADPAAAPLLAIERELDIARCGETLVNQELAEEHLLFSYPDQPAFSGGSGPT